MEQRCLDLWFQLQLRSQRTESFEILATALCCSKWDRLQKVSLDFLGPILSLTMNNQNKRIWATTVFPLLIQLYEFRDEACYICIYNP